MMLTEPFGPVAKFDCILHQKLLLPQYSVNTSLDVRSGMTVFPYEAFWYEIKPPGGRHTYEEVQILG